MKINENKRIGSLNPYSKTNENRPAGLVGKKDKPKDQVQISAEAKELLGALGSARTDEQNIRIEELKSSVASGTYRVEAGKLADKILPFLK